MKIKVLGIIPDLLIGGGENRLLNIARSIDKDLVDYRVACLYLPLKSVNEGFGDMRPEFASEGIDVIDLNLPRPGHGHQPSPLRTVGTGVTLARIARSLATYVERESIDILDAHLENALLPVSAASRLAGRPATLTLYRGNLFGEKPWLRPFGRVALRHAAAIVTDSEEEAWAIRTFIGKGTPAIHVIPNGVRLPPPVRTRKQVLEELSLSQNVPLIVGQVSGLIHFKGHHVLLDAARQVLKRRPEVRFIMVGFARSGPTYLESLKEHAHYLGIAEAIRIHPYQGSIADIWNIIDVHVHASEMDSLPNAIIEGMSLGKPAVVTAVGGIPKMVTHEQTGLVVPPGSADALATAILRLLDDPEFAMKLGAAARRRYLERCTPEHMTREIESIFLLNCAARFQPPSQDRSDFS